MKSTVSWLLVWLGATCFIPSSASTTTTSCDPAFSLDLATADGQFVDIPITSGDPPRIVALHTVSGALLLEAESLDGHSKTWIEHVTCSGERISSWPDTWVEISDFGSPPTLYFRVGTVDIPTEPGEREEAAARIRLSALSMPLCSWTSSLHKSEETEERDEEIILLTGPEGPCVGPRPPATKSDETEERDEEIILRDGSEPLPGPCGSPEPWNNLRGCAPQIALGDRVSSDLVGTDIDFFAFESTEVRHTLIFLTGDLPTDVSVQVFDEAGRTVAAAQLGSDGLQLAARLEPGRYLLRVAGSNGSYALRLLDRGSP